MRIVHIEDFFHPDAGYQINILPKYMVKQGHQVIIVTSEMEKVPANLTMFFGKENIEEADRRYEKDTGVKIIRLPLIGFVSGRAIFKDRIFEEVDNLEPDIVYVHGNDTLIGIQYTLKYKNLNYPIVLDSHMLEMASKNKFNNVFRKLYRLFITPIIVKNNIKVIRTQNDNYVERFLGIPLFLCPWISVGSDTLLFSPDNSARTFFRKENSILESDFLIVYTGKLDESKGGKFLATTFLKEFENTKKRVILMVVGNSSGKYGDEIEEIFKESQNRILRFPTDKYINLPKYYQSADLCIFPKQCSLSFYDAQACGLPVIAEDNNINIDRLSYNNGFVFKENNTESFRKKIEQAINLSEDDYNRMATNSFNSIKKNYDYKTIAKEYSEILIEEFKRFHKGEY